MPSNVEYEYKNPLVKNARRIPAYLISVRDNYISQYYANYSSTYLQTYYKDKLKLLYYVKADACSPETLHEFKERYPEVNLVKRERPVRNPSDKREWRDFSSTEKSIWYSQYDTWVKIARSGEKSIVLEHDVIPIQGRETDWDFAMQFDYFTFTAHERLGKLDEDGNPKFQISEIAGYVLSPELASWVVDHCKKSWNEESHCSFVNTDGAWAEVIRQAKKTGKFKIQSEEEGYTPGKVVGIKDLSEHVSCKQKKVFLIGTTIDHPRIYRQGDQ